MTALIEFLNQIPICLKDEGVAFIITYHSLEDRLVRISSRVETYKGC